MNLSRYSIGLWGLIVLFAATVATAQPYRGFNIPDSILPSKIVTMDSLYGPSFVRLNLNWGTSANSGTVAEYNDWLLDVLDYIDASVLPSLSSAGIKAILSLSSPPGGFASYGNKPQFRIFVEQEFQTAIKDVWQLLANRYASNTTIIAFQLLSEPAVGSSTAAGLLDWYDLQEELISIVRAIDTSHIIGVTPEYSNYKKLNKITVPSNAGSLWHIIHIYWPSKFLNQGLGTIAPYSLKWPNKKKKSNGNPYTKKGLKKELKKAKKFADDNDVQIYVAEYSTPRQSPINSSWKYLSDIHSIFLEYGWYATFHAWAEAAHWDPTYAALEDNDLDNDGIDDDLMTMRGQEIANFCAAP